MNNQPIRIWWLWCVFMCWVQPITQLLNLLSASLVPKPNQQRKGLVTKARILVLKFCNFRWRINKCFVLKNSKLLAVQLKLSTCTCSCIIFSLTSQTHFHKQGTVYKLCPASAACTSILSHDALHDCLSSNSSLENGERELGHLFRYSRSCKNTTTIYIYFSGNMLTPQQVNSRVHYLISGYVIQLIAFQWDMACICTLPDPFLLLWKWVGPARLHYITENLE